MTQDSVLVLLNTLQEQLGVECITICGMDVIYNPNMNDGEWEIFDHDGDHDRASSDIYEASELILAILLDQ